MPIPLPSRTLEAHAAMLLTALAICVAAPTPATAADPSSDIQLELVASILFDGSIDEDALGIRASHRLAKLSPRFWVDARIDHYDTGSLEFWLLQLSARYFYDDDGRWRWYVIGGPGATFRSLDDLDDSGLILHVGTGVEIDLTPRLYLRPEVLGLWREDDLDTFSGDVSLALGWRF